MKNYIDQSGKIEQTEKDTVLCLANDSWDAILIRAKSKRQLQEIFRRSGMIRNFVLFTFCAGLFILLKRNLGKNLITIDEEYFGKGNIIKNILLEMFKNSKPIPDFQFAFIGKRVSAHQIANDIATRKQTANKIADIAEILKAIKKTEVGKRLKNA